MDMDRNVMTIEWIKLAAAMLDRAALKFATLDDPASGIPPEWSQEQRRAMLAAIHFDQSDEGTRATSVVMGNGADASEADVMRFLAGRLVEVAAREERRIETARRATSEANRERKKQYNRGGPKRKK